MTRVCSRQRGGASNHGGGGPVLLSSSWWVRPHCFSLPVSSPASGWARLEATLLGCWVWQVGGIQSLGSGLPDSGAALGGAVVARVYLDSDY